MCGPFQFPRGYDKLLLANVARVYARVMLLANLPGLPAPGIIPWLIATFLVVDRKFRNM
jgi:hypothetical protein